MAGDATCITNSSALYCLVSQQSSMSLHAQWAVNVQTKIGSDQSSMQGTAECALVWECISIVSCSAM